MAFRGRGGRGGRGRFGGGARYVPEARGDDGLPVHSKKIDGPPPLFPELKALPELPDVGKAEEELISQRRRLETFWNASPYFIEKPKEKWTGVAAEIERYSDKYKPNFKAKRPPLSSVLKLTSAYFPAELVGQQAAERKRGRDGRYKGTSQWTLDASSHKSDLQRLDKLETMEQRSEKNADKEEKEEGKKTEEGDDEDDEEVEEEEEEEIGEDDYAQNFGFDDDDDYLDDDDGGDDEGPTY